MSNKNPMIYVEYRGYIWDYRGYIWDNLLSDICGISPLIYGIIAPRSGKTRLASRVLSQLASQGVLPLQVGVKG